MRLFLGPQEGAPAESGSQRGRHACAQASDREYPVEASVPVRGVPSVLAHVLCYTEVVRAARDKELAAANEAVRAQWAKFGAAQARGLTGAPLVMIDNNLQRLEHERDALADRLREQA